MCYLNLGQHNQTSFPDRQTNDTGGRIAQKLKKIKSTKNPNSINSRNIGHEDRPHAFHLATSKSPFTVTLVPLIILSKLSLDSGPDERARTYTCRSRVRTCGCSIRKHHRIIFTGHHYHCFFLRRQPLNVQRMAASFPPRFHFHAMSFQHVQKISIILLHDRIRNYRWPTIISGPRMYQTIHTIFIDDCLVIARSYALSIVYHRWGRNLTNTDVYTIDCITSSHSTYRSSCYCVKLVECSIKPKYRRLQLGKFHGDQQLFDRRKELERRKKMYASPLVINPLRRD